MMNGFNELYGSYRTLKFTDIYDNVEDFLKDYRNENEDFPNQIPRTITDTNATTLFYLLYANYGNSHISNSDIYQFKYRLFSTIFNYGDTWEVNLSNQQRLKGMTEDEILQIQKSVVNHSYNPGDGATGSVNGDVILNTINDQNVNKMSKGKLEGYATWAALFRDVTTDFVNKFKPLFLTIVNPELPLWYISENTDEEI